MWTGYGWRRRWGFVIDELRFTIDDFGFMILDWVGVGRAERVLNLKSKITWCGFSTPAKPLVII